MKKIPTGIDNFKVIIENNYYYVDKTQVIEELILQKEDGTILFPRPRRFGKSLFISMLDNFFNIEKKEENKNLFDGLTISKSSVYGIHLNKYPVVHLDFKDIKANTFESTFKGLKDSITKLYKSKKYIKEVLDKEEKEYFKFIENQQADEDAYKKSLSNLCI